MQVLPSDQAPPVAISAVPLAVTCCLSNGVRDLASLLSINESLKGIQT